MTTELEFVEGNSRGLILSTIQARYLKVLRKTAINLSKDSEYKAAVLTTWSRNLANVLLFLSTFLAGVLRCKLYITRAVSGVGFHAFVTNGIAKHEGAMIAQSV